MSNDMILIAEDEREIAEIIKAYLERAGFRTVTAADGNLALSHFHQLKPALVLLDVKMPKQDGIEVLRIIRQTSDTPVIMVTAMAEDLEKISALRLGADDYVVKPFNALEVVERVKAVLRRSGMGAQPEGRPVTVGALVIDKSAHSVFAIGDGTRAPVPLTQTEYAIIAHMSRTPQRAFSRAELIDACVPEGDVLERTIDSHVSNARRKLEEAGIAGFLETVRGVGYRLEPLA